MTLLIILFTLALVQIWGSGAPLHRDRWFDRWSAYVGRLAQLREKEGLQLGFSILLPVLAVALIMVLIESSFGALGVLLLGVPLLLYCLGRGNFNDILSAYLRSWYRGDFKGAAEAARPCYRTFMKMLPRVDACMNRFFAVRHTVLLSGFLPYCFGLFYWGFPGRCCFV